METITLFKSGGMWVCKHSDPRITELFGADILPTPYTDKMDSGTVLRRIKVLNPDRIVEINV